jgi:flavin-dependent dehydrogenase
MDDEIVYDVSIIGGGLAGLSLAIQLIRQGCKVILFEKETYPFHKVCGEYISMESWPFLQSLGVPLEQMNLPRIKNLLVTAPDGTSLHAELPLGGFGISRYTLDAMLKDIAVAAGAKVLDNCKVNDVTFLDDLFSVSSSKGNYKSKVCCGSYGKKSNLDVKWKRVFTLNSAKRLNQYAGIKYHIETDFPADRIALHNFSDGYCGISKIEGSKYCLCYLTHTDNLKANNQSIEQMEERVLSNNPHLKKILNESRKLFAKPVSIAQVSFLPKTQVEDHVLLLGDAAGMITPLCGNGMSMALHGSKLTAGQVMLYLQKKVSRTQMETGYRNEWQKHFSRRLLVGRTIQYFFGKTWMTNFFIRAMKQTPTLTRWLIRQTHGEPF